MADETAPDEAPLLVPSNDITSTPDDVARRSQLQSLIVRATALYGKKLYTDAADLYADAATLQSQLNGELAPENADLLYSYGRCLYKVALANSDVLGGKVPDSGAQQGPGAGRGQEAASSSKKRKGEDTSTEHASKKAKTEDIEDKVDPRFDFGTEEAEDDWEDDDESDADDGDDAAPDADGDEQDDFATAYEILDVARVLLTKRLSALEEVPHPNTSSTTANGKTPATAAEPPSPSLSVEERRIKETLADTHDIQAEILLENEQFVNAVADSRASLALKTQLYPLGSNLVAEAHFKLALALEFASVTPEASNGVEEGAGPAKTDATADGQERDGGVDVKMRGEAAEQMELAIASTRLRLEQERGKLVGMQPDSEDAIALARTIHDVEDMVGEMEAKLADLKAPATALTGATASLLETDPALAAMGADLKGLIGSLIGGGGASAAAASAAAAQRGDVTRAANDLTGVVRKKRKE